MVNTNWFQDEEWWKKYLATQIYSMWKEETDNEKKEEIKKDNKPKVNKTTVEKTALTGLLKRVS